MILIIINSEYNMSFLKSLYKFCFFIFAFGFIITIDMRCIVLIYYYARQNSNILDTYGKIFIAS
jgi:hypothetical protein